jgi:16S rRNA (guanine(1405)-N(7))-methyltransferase
MPDSAAPVDQLVDAVRKSPKYHSVCEDLIRNIGSQELAKRRPLKEAIKTTKSTLHQVSGAYLGNGIDYAAGLTDLRKAAQSTDNVDWRDACAALMSLHASTRERLPILDPFYATTLAHLAPIRSILDVACGLNPLAIPWMPLAPDVEYHAFDICEEMTGFLNEFLALVPCHGRAHVADVTQSCPTQKADVAFILKSLPCLEQIDRSAGVRLLETINADHLLVSFPVTSLGGKGKGMVRHYEAQFQELVADKNWKVKRFEFSSELAFVVTR